MPVRHAMNVLRGFLNTDPIGDSVSTAYRPDIDGLRAVAVLPVVAFHLGVPLTPGGFVGVDVFFVISGYLITGILLKDLAAGRFSLARFYERRVRRLFPAFFAVMAFTLIAGYWILFPSEFEALGMNMVAAIAFVSNMYLYETSSYFAGAAETNPLLHTWSLSVEEQFYLVFPLLLLATFRFGKMPLAGLFVALGAVSFLLSVWMVAVRQEAAFYIVVFRMWELLLGAFLALGILPRFTWRLIPEALGILGIGLIAASVWFYHKYIDFPGILALAPCVGAGLVIYSGSHDKTLVSRLLSWRGPVFIGLISYSLYLWHWPIIVFTQLHLGRALEAGDMVLIFLVSLAVSALSWRYIEQPFRRAGATPRTRVALSAAALMTGGLALALVPVLAAGFPGRFSNETLRLAAYIDYDDREVYRRGTCFIDSHVQTASDFDTDTCLAMSPDKRNYLLIGDSHGAHLWQALARELPGTNVLQATASGCKPVLDGRGERPCTQIVNRVLGQFTKESRLDAIVISARWSPEDLPDLRRTIDFLAPRVSRIYVMGPIVEYDGSLARLLAQAERGGDAGLVEGARRRGRAEVDAVLSRAISEMPATYVSTYRLLCAADGQCVTRTADGTPVQWDYGHLTGPGARMVVMNAVRAGRFSGASAQTGG